MATPTARLTSIRLEAQGVSASAVEKRLVTASLVIDEAIGGGSSYGDQVIETDMNEPEGAVTYHKGRAKIWPNTADDAPQHRVLGIE